MAPSDLLFDSGEKSMLKVLQHLLKSITERDCPFDKLEQVLKRMTESERPDEKDPTKSLSPGDLNRNLSYEPPIQSSVVRTVTVTSPI
jgi:hypothetical protein